MKAKMNLQCPEGQDRGVYGGGPPFLRWKSAIITWAQPIRHFGKFCRCPSLIWTLKVDSDEWKVWDETDEAPNVVFIFSFSQQL